MVRGLPPLVARPLIGLWLATSPRSWRRQVMADDSPHLHARGTDADRVLLTGDGAAAGRGVRTHDLGLPGHLARALSVHTGRATDVDLVVTADMTARTCLAAVSDADLFRYDVVVVSLGANEALSLTSVSSWRDALGALLDDLELRAPAATRIFVLTVPLFGSNPHFPPRLARTVDDHVEQLNEVLQQIAAVRERVTVVAPAQTAAFEREGTHLYRRWAEGIALRIIGALDPERSAAERASAPDELRRQRALDAMQVATSEADPVLDDLAGSARTAFGTAFSAITLITSDTQLIKAATGFAPVVLPRSEAFCDTTIRQAGHFVVEDARADSRYADYSVVTGDLGVRFYAGYPIESPDGQRIGALCIMDTEPRAFTDLDAELLRTLAGFAEDHLHRKVAG
jgi:hypothetical protein